jgi:elongation factor G
VQAMFGVDCASGTTFTDGTKRLSMTSMFVPEAVLSLAVRPKNRSDDNNFSKALNRFQKEDPTFRVHFDSESKETILSGMGELHLEVFADLCLNFAIFKVTVDLTFSQIYLERMKREYKVETVSGAPRVNYREAISKKAPFEYLHKKQSGGSGQYGGVKGYIEPLPEDHPTKLEFKNNIIGTIIPSEFIPAIEKGFIEACEKSPLTGHRIEGVRFVLEDGKAHPVDSNENAFRSAALWAVRQAYEKAGAQVLEPIMNVEIESPAEFQSQSIALISKRRGAIRETLLQDGDSVKVLADVPLSQMFGFSTDLRSCTMGASLFSSHW